MSLGFIRINLASGMVIQHATFASWARRVRVHVLIPKGAVA